MRIATSARANMSSEFADSNRKWWNEQAATYNTAPWQQKMSSQITSFVTSNLALLGLDETSTRATHRLLDYACGTGVVTTGLAPYVHDAQGVDIAPSMVQRYNETFASSSPAGNADFTAKAIDGDLTAEQATDDEKLLESHLYNFDVAVIGLGFHHFESPALSIRRLAERVKPWSGIVGIIDFVDDGGSFPSQAAHTVKTPGFSRADMEQLFQDAGLRDFQWRVMEGKVEMVGKDGASKLKTVFLASASRS